jgi:ProP effector
MRGGRARWTIAPFAAEPCASPAPDMSSETPSSAPSPHLDGVPASAPEAAPPAVSTDVLPVAMDHAAEPSAAQPPMSPGAEPPMSPGAEPTATAADAPAPDPQADAVSDAGPEGQAATPPAEVAPADGGADGAGAAAGADAATPEGAAAGAAAVPPAAQTPVRLDLESCAAELKQRFPALFTGQPKPIKLRIQTDIQQRAPGVFTRQALSAFLRRHTGSTSYLIALGKATQRLDLDGQPAGEIAAEHHAAAAEELARRRALRREREQAMRPGQRPPREGHGPAPAGPQGDGTAPTDATRPADAAGGPEHARPPRPPRPPRHDRPQRSQQGPRDAQGGQGGRPTRPARPPLGQQTGQAHTHQTNPGQRPPQPARPAGAALGADTMSRPAPVANAAQRAAPVADDPARRERMLLLRAFDSSPLTKSNFCALKGMTVEHLDAQLTVARQEAAAWAAAHPQPERSPDRPHDRGFDRRPDGRSSGSRDGPRDGQRDGRRDARTGPGRPGGPGGPRRDHGPAKGGAR